MEYRDASQDISLEQLISFIKQFHELGWVHCDCSIWNIGARRGHPVFLDMGRAYQPLPTDDYLKLDQEWDLEKFYVSVDFNVKKPMG